jgi:hypothetical protein
LKIALDSPEPVIRVQAAAVAARIREQLKSGIEKMLARAADPTLTPGAAVTLAADLDATVASGLLEESARAQAARLADGLRARTFARLDAPDGRKATSMTPAANDAYLAHLLAAGRFADFRAHRTRVRRPTTGRYRHRVIVMMRADRKRTATGGHR